MAVCARREKDEGGGNGHDGDVGRRRLYEPLDINVRPRRRDGLALANTRRPLTHERRANRLPRPSSATDALVRLVIRRTREILAGNTSSKYVWRLTHSRHYVLVCLSSSSFVLTNLCSGSGGQEIPSNR